MFQKTLILLAFLSFFAFSADTLEIFALRVEFKEEIPDNSLTTGTGLFDSDPDAAKKNYSLDPQGRRASALYWNKHFEFAKQYYKRVSQGKLILKYRVFPESGSAYKLDKHIIDYNRTNKKKNEKTAEYDEARSRDYMSFIWDAIQKAHSDAKSPFNEPAPQNTNTQRAYMIIHAGSSRLLDGGTMGTNGANTPGDFIDVFVSSDFWEYLPDSLAQKKHTQGIVLNTSSIDTLKEVMVVSETASQDGLNWGINGIIVNQIGRFLGMPNTYDVVKGISRLGYFDLMDFAGYNAGNGFFPVLPSAWLRIYMGWAEAIEVQPSQKNLKFELAAAGSGLGVEILKIPLTNTEYLLIENRQRSWNKEGTVDVLIEDADTDNAKIKTHTIPIDSLSLLFEDSVCVKNKCTPNKKKASGIIVGTSSFDAALPASGIVVWKVNEWYLKESLPYGVTNFWGGDTFRDHQFGISLVEADGILSIGKTFKNALGQDAYDYGSGTDLLPHIRFTKDSALDTVSSILPKAYANTATTMGGLSGIEIQVKPKSAYRKERSENTFMGDSVLNFASLSMEVEISFGENKIPKSQFPKNIGIKTKSNAVVSVDYPSSSLKSKEKALVFASENGTLQILSAHGEALIESDTSVFGDHGLSVKGSTPEQALYRLGTPKDSLIGIASSEHFIVSSYPSGVLVTELEPLLDQVTYKQRFLKIPKLKTVPLLSGDTLWVASNSKLYALTFKKGLQVIDSTKLQGTATHQIALCKASGTTTIAIASEDAFLELYTPQNKSLYKASFSQKKSNEFLSTKEQVFSIACSDFKRDGTAQIWLLGSLGYGRMIQADSSLKAASTPRQFKRGFTSGAEIYHEYSAPAIADIDDDGYPDVVFLGHNLLYALNKDGVPLQGFPSKISNGIPEYSFQSDPLILNHFNKDKPGILIGTPNGLLKAFDYQGKQIKDGFPLASGSFEYTDSLYPMTIILGDFIDSLPKPIVYSFHKEFVSGFQIPEVKTKSKNSVLAWSSPGQSNERNYYFDANQLKKPSLKIASESIEDFYLYPNPIKNGIAKSRFTLGMDASSASLDIYDISGHKVFSKSLKKPYSGKNQIDHIDLSSLGSDIYTVVLKVKFKSGKEKQKTYRIGVLR